jgi:hypothetical protein
MYSAYCLQLEGASSSCRSLMCNLTLPPVIRSLDRQYILTYHYTTRKVTIKMHEKILPQYHIDNIVALTLTFQNSKPSDPNDLIIPFIHEDGTGVDI